MNGWRSRDETWLCAAVLILAFIVGENFWPAFAESPIASGTKPKIAIIDPPEKEFLSKRLEFHGIPIKAHKVVVDDALFAAFDRLSLLLSNQPMALSNLTA